MLATQIPRINPDEFSRREERSQKTDHGKNLSPSQKMDVAIKESIDQAFWKDDVLRAIEYHEIEIHVKNGIVYLYGHIVSTTSQSRIQTAIRAIPGILGIQNDLVLDDKLTLEVAASLGTLEHTYDCKFFTGASHGVISLNGNVRDENVKLLAEKRAASNPNVRGVINNVRVSGVELEL
jgi:osmotically-inducible protein OsmY